MSDNIYAYPSIKKSMQSKKQLDFIRIKEICFFIKNGLLKNEERKVFLELASYYNKLSTNERKYIADELQHTRIISANAINAIIYDKAHICKNFIKNSPSLNDERLISFIHDNHDIIKLHAIAQRKYIGEKLKASLIKFGNKRIAELLSGNGNADIDFTELSNSTDSVLTHSQLSKQYFELKIYNMPFDEISKSSMFIKIKRDFDNIIKISAPNYTFLIRYLCKGMPLSFLYLLSKKSEISFSVVFDIFIHNTNKQEIIELLRQSKMPHKFCTIVYELFKIINEGMMKEKITPSNMRAYLLKNVKDINLPNVSREISYIEKMI